MGDKRRANNFAIIGLAASAVVVLTGGAFIFFTQDISTPPSSSHASATPEQLILTAASSTSSLNQPAAPYDWTSYQHVDLPLKYMYPRNWIHEEAIPKGIGPKTFQIYPVEGPPIVIYVTFLDAQSYKNLGELQIYPRKSSEFHGSLSRISLNGIDALDETFARNQYRGGPWMARTVSVFYNKTIVEFALQLEYNVSPLDEQAARTIFDSLLNSILLSR